MRKPRWTRATALSVVGSVVGMLAAVAPSAPAAATTCSLAPVLQEASVNQGVAAYSTSMSSGTANSNPLVWGKQTLVKLYLTLPSCALPGQGIEITGASLRVSNVASPTTIAFTPPTSTTGCPASPPNPACVVPAGSYSPTGDSNNTSDPIFVVPGANLTSSGGAAFTANFSVTLNFVSFSSSTDVVGTTTTNYAPPNGNFTKSYDHQSDALRILIEPMGDATSKLPQWTQGAQSALVSGLSALSRILPVADGVADLAAPNPASGPPPGIRYHIDAGPVDLGPSGLGYMNLTNGSQLFCGTQQNFGSDQTTSATATAAQTNGTGVAGALQDKLSAWNTNSNNSSAQADRVLGVIDETVDTFSANCAGGYADVNGFHAWSRVNWQTSSPQWVASLAAMELGHTLGMSAVAPSNSPTCATFVGDPTHHSLDNAADGCSPNRAFNTQFASYDQYDRVVSHLEVSDNYWQDNNVLLEPQDYQWGQCILGGSSTACSSQKSTVGSFSPAQSSATTCASFTINYSGTCFQLTGALVTDTTGNVTARVDNSYTAPNGYVTPPPSTSAYSLRYLDSNGLPLGSDPVWVTAGGELHNLPSPTTDTGVAVSEQDFYSSLPLPTGAATVELVANATGQVLYTASKDASAPLVNGQPQQPTDSLVTPGTLQDLTPNSGHNSTAPAASTAGLLAWSTGNGLVFATAPGSSLTAGRVTFGAAGDTNVSFNSDGTRFAYEDAQGNIFTDNITYGLTNSWTLGATPTQVYSSTFNNSLFPVHHPALSPAGDAVAIEYNGNIFVIYLPGSSQATSTLGCSLPGKLVSGLSCQQVTGVSGTGGIVPASDHNPSWTQKAGGTTIAFDRPDPTTSGQTDLYTVDTCATQTSSGACQPGAPTPLVTTASQPSWSTGLIAYQSSGDINLSDPTTSPIASQTVTHLGVDSHPGLAFSSGSGWLVFQRPVNGESDVYVVALSQPDNNGATTYTAVATDDAVNPGLLRAEFFRSCPASGSTPAIDNVLAAALPPNDISGNEARFQYSLNPAAVPTLGCSGGTVTVRVSDRWYDSAPVQVGTVAAASNPLTTSVASAAGQYRAGHLVGLTTAAYDSDSGPVPAADYSWSITSACHSAYTFTGKAAVYITPPACSTPYSVTVTVTENNRTATATTSFTVVQDKPPVVTINSPSANSAYPPNAQVPLSAAATDPEDGTLPAGSILWTAVAPDGTVLRAAGSPTSITATVPGKWQLTATATDSDGSVGSRSTTFLVDQQAKVNFSPSTINAPPLPSDPNWVTTNTSLSGYDLTQVNPATVHIYQIGPAPCSGSATPCVFTSANGLPQLYAGYQYTTGAACLTPPCYSAANAWTVSGTVSTGQTATAQFDRIALANFLAKVGMNSNEYVPIYISGSAPTYGFFGVDPASPTVKSGT